jgi:hypothetical protein
MEKINLNLGFEQRAPKMLGFECEGALKAINRVAEVCDTFEFTERGCSGHPWNAFEFMANHDKNGNDAWVDDHGFSIYYSVAKALHEPNGSWEPVADIAGHREHDNVPVYRLKPEFAALVKERMAIEASYLDKRLAKIQNEKNEKIAHLQSVRDSVADIKTTVQDITDEGGKTKLYHHTVTCHSGTKFNFSERNVFDFGRVINPEYAVLPGGKSGGIPNIIDGKYYWMLFDEDKGGWNKAREVVGDELIALSAVKELGLYADQGIRM